MKKHVLFLQGGGGKEDHRAGAKLAESLRKNLGAGYEIHYPVLPNKESEPDFGRLKQIEEAISPMDGEIIVVAHSFGASMLLKYLSEYKLTKQIAAVFLLATPFWAGAEEWKQGFKLEKGFEKRLPPDVLFYFYHARDDEEVPFQQLSQYRDKMKNAVIRELNQGGHYFDNNLSYVAADIKAIEVKK